MVHDDIHPFLHVLGKAGCDADMVKEVVYYPAEAYVMIANFRLRKKQYLTPPRDQVAYLRKANREWGMCLSEETFQAAAKMDIHFSVSNLSRVPVLVPHWSDEGAAGNGPYKDRMGVSRESIRCQLYRMFCADPKLEALSGRNDFTSSIEQDDPELHAVFDRVGGVRPGDGLAWYMLDLTANQGKMPDRFKNQESGLAVLAAAIMHPVWMLAMNGQNIPFAWLEGTVVASSRGSLECVGLSCEREGAEAKIVIARHDANTPRAEFCVPRILEILPVVV